MLKIFAISSFLLLPGIGFSVEYHCYVGEVKADREFDFKKQFTIDASQTDFDGAVMIEDILGLYCGGSTSNREKQTKMAADEQSLICVLVTPKQGNTLPSAQSVESKTIKEDDQDLLGMASVANGSPRLTFLATYDRRQFAAICNLKQ